MTNKATTIFSVVIVILILATWGVFAQNGMPDAPCDFNQMYGMMAGQGMGNSPTDMMGFENCWQDGLFGMGMLGGMMGTSSPMGMDGMMMGGNSENMGRFGPGNGMMGAWTPPAELVPADGLTIEDAEAIATAYIEAWDAEVDLELEEVMAFENNFYAIAHEVESGRSAFEFLIDPETGVVVGEPGPNMMWNLRYGMGMSVGMFNSVPAGDEMPISLEEAREYAQAVLDQSTEGAEVSEDGSTFYGYYTFHIAQDGEITGMLSVNGYNGQVWVHHWHGQFVGMSEHAE